MRCPDFANIDELLDQLQARWLFAIDMGAADSRGVYKPLFRIAFVATISGMQFLIATLQHTHAAHGVYFAPEARNELKAQIALLIETFEAQDSVARARERSDPRVGSTESVVHHLYPIVSEERRHSAR